MLDILATRIREITRFELDYAVNAHRGNDAVVFTAVTVTVHLTQDDGK